MQTRKAFEGIEVARMFYLKKIGKTYKQIAEMMYCSSGTVRRYLTMYHKKRC